MKKKPSTGEVPATEYVNILAKVTCGFASMILEVASNNPTTNIPISIPVLVDCCDERDKNSRLAIIEDSYTCKIKRG
jgi:hypothetical protein